MENTVPQYVTDLINKIAIEQNFVDYTVSAETETRWDGFQSLIVEVVISGRRNNCDDKLFLICKIPSPNITRRREFHSDIAFDQELFFYENVFPYFEAFQRERGVSDDDGFFAFPKCYGTVRDNEYLGDHAIVMENLKEKNFYILDKAKEIDYDHSILLLTELGKLHAVSFAIRDQQPEKFKEFMQRTSIFHEAIDQSIGARLIKKSLINRAIRSLHPSETNLIKKMEALKLTYQNLLTEVKSNTNCEPFGVMIHGDCWVNNLLYQCENDYNRPTGVCLIDWQLGQFGSPAVDVACFLFCSLSPELRNEHFDRFLEIYHISLSLTLSLLGSDPQKLFTFDNLKDQMQKFSRYVMFLAPIMVGIIATNRNNVPGIDEIVDRMEKLSKDPTADIKLDDLFEENQQYKHRMSNVIRDMDRMGYW